MTFIVTASPFCLTFAYIETNFEFCEKYFILCHSGIEFLLFLLY